MRRRNPQLVAFCCIVAAWPLASAGRSLAGSRPNIVLIMTDDQGYGPVGRHGHPWIRTPSLDRLHDAGVRFSRFLASPSCSPTRAALMTGRHAMRSGVTNTMMERERLNLSSTTLPEVLKSAGYTTAIFGKWHLGDEEPYQPHNRGFDEAFIHGCGGIGQTYRCSCADVPDNGYFDPVVRHNGTFVKTEGFCTDVFFTAAAGWIKEVKGDDRPFFAFISTNAPHRPFDAPSEYSERFLALGFNESHAGFYGMVENIDRNVGRLLLLLERWRLLETTLVIFMSDNGMTEDGGGRPGQRLGQAPDGTTLLSYNAGMKGTKAGVDEGGVRVPFFMRWDGRIQPGREVDRVASDIDILPTLADLAGATLPGRQVEGRSLLPLVEDPQAEWLDRLLFSHNGRWDPGEDPDRYQWKAFAVRSERYRLVGRALYDMVEDPGQTTDVSRLHPEIVAIMRAGYDVWWKATRPLMVNESAPIRPTRPFQDRFEWQLRGRGIPVWNAPEL